MRLSQPESCCVTLRCKAVLDGEFFLTHLLSNVNMIFEMAIGHLMLLVRPKQELIQLSLQKNGITTRAVKPTSSKFSRTGQSPCRNPEAFPFIRMKMRGLVSQRRSKRRCFHRMNESGTPETASKNQSSES